MKKVKILLGVLLAIAWVDSPIMVSASVQSEAAVTQTSRLMTAAEYTEAKAAPDVGAETVITYDKGATVYVIGETSDGWYRVSYQEKEGYVTIESLGAIEVDLNALAKEMENEETAGKIVAEEVERTRNEDERSKSWIIALAIIIGGMFITGILIASVSSKRRRRRRKRRRH